VAALLPAKTPAMTGCVSVRLMLVRYYSGVTVQFDRPERTDLLNNV
jgi:hypothetical protein